MDMKQIMKQASQLQKKLKEQQEALACKEYEAASGGGMVTVRVNGKGEVLQTVIDPEVVSKDDVEMLQDLIVAAVNEALKRAQEAQQGTMMDAMGDMGIKIPGLS